MLNSHLTEGKVELKVRLSPEILHAIHKSYSTHFSSGTELYLYGSRTHLDKKGGDIDLLITANTPSDKLKALHLKTDFIIDIKKEIGEQKIDVTICTIDELSSKAFYQIINTEKVKLS